MILVWILSTEERKYIHLSSKPLITAPDFLLEPLNQLTLRLNPNSRIQVTGNLEFSDLRGTRHGQSRWTKADSRVSESDPRETMKRLVLTAQESCGWCHWEKGWMGSAEKSMVGVAGRRDGWDLPRRASDAMIIIGKKADLPESTSLVAKI